MTDYQLEHVLGADPDAPVPGPGGGEPARRETAPDTYEVYREGFAGLPFDEAFVRASYEQYLAAVRDEQLRQTGR